MKLSQLVFLFISVFSLMVSSGCTSSQTEGDQSSAAVTDESLEMAEAIDNNDDLSLDFDGGDDAFADLGDDFSDFSADSELALSDPTATDPLAMDATAGAATTEKAPLVGSDDLSEVPLADSAAPMEAPLDEMAPDFGAPLEDSAAPDFGAPTDDTALADNMAPIESAEPDFGAPLDSSSDATFEPTPEPLSTDDSYAATDTSSDMGMMDSSSTEVAESTPTYIPLKKVITEPYMHNGKPVNAIYMAREGDTLQSISQKIFGGDRVQELCSINAYNCSRSLKVGDKYYYNSPQRPDDKETVKTFYEDAGIPAQMYTTKVGDNIRELGSTLLGNRRSWMELWATNPDVESKGELPEGVTLRYWPTTDVSMPTLAQNEPMVAPEPEPEMAAPAPAMEEPAMPMPPPVEEAPPAEDMALNDIPEAPAPDMNQAPPVDDFAQNDMGNNDMNTGAGMGSMNNVEPPPPPPPPPPPVTSPSDNMNNMAANSAMEDPNQTMALGVGAILLLAGVALFIAIRKRRARRPVDFNTTTQTQIE